MTGASARVVPVLMLRFRMTVVCCGWRGGGSTCVTRNHIPEGQRWGSSDLKEAPPGPLCVTHLVGGTSRDVCQPGMDSAHVKEESCKA